MYTKITFSFFVYYIKKNRTFNFLDKVLFYIEGTKIFLKTYKNLNLIKYELWDSYQEAWNLSCLVHNVDYYRLKFFRLRLRLLSIKIPLFLCKISNFIEIIICNKKLKSNKLYLNKDFWYKYQVIIIPK